MISWKRTRKGGAVARGVQELPSGTVLWIIKKSSGGLNYQLYLGEESVSPIFTRPTINDCKAIAEGYL